MDERYSDAAWRRALKVQEVILKHFAGELSLVEAEEIMDLSPRHFYRLRMAFQEKGVDGLIDRRRGRPSPRKVAAAEAEVVLKLYWGAYRGFNVKHFHEKLVEEHGLDYSYTWVKNLLQEAGYVKRGKGRGGHRLRRERRPLFGQMVHLDGSKHEWLLLRPGEKQTLLLAIDDATGRNLAAELVEEEETATCMRIMRRVVEEYGIPAQFYSDRDSVYWKTEKKGGRVVRNNPTQFGRSLEELGVEMIPAYSPQARGRGERWNQTWQGRLPQELRAAGVRDLGAANRYIREKFLPDMNRRFTVEATESGSAFVSAGRADLDRVFSKKHRRTVGADNTLRVNSLTLQLSASPYRISFAQCAVDVYEHLEGGYSVDWNKKPIGEFDRQGTAKKAPERGDEKRASNARQRGPGAAVKTAPNGRRKTRAKTKSRAVGLRSAYGLASSDCSHSP